MQRRKPPRSLVTLLPRGALWQTVLHGLQCNTVCCMVHSAVLSATAKNRRDLMMRAKEENSYRIGRRAVKQGPRHPAGDQAGVEKLTIRTGTDSSGNDRS